jgi:hypothetical protein
MDKKRRSEMLVPNEMGVAQFVADVKGISSPVSGSHSINSQEVIIEDVYMAKTGGDEANGKSVNVLNSPGNN